MSRRSRISLVLALVLAGALLNPYPPYAATPSDGTLSPSSGPLDWDGPAQTAQTFSLEGSVLGGDHANKAASDETCAAEGAHCDDFLLTVDVAESYWDTQQGGARVIIAWASENDDFDLYIFDKDDGGVADSSAAGGTTEEEALVPDASGQYIVRTVYFSTVEADYHGVATFETGPRSLPPPGGAAPRYQIFHAPPGLGELSGEPTIGSNWTTSDEKFTRAMYIAWFDTMRVTFDECTSPPRVTWEDKSPPQVASADPFLFQDSTTGRCINSQLLGKTSNMYFSDNDGDTWTPSQGAGFNSGVDHQSFAIGPYRGPAPVGASFPSSGTKKAVYYCSQDVADALCARSDNGGQTFGAAVPIYTLLQCVGVHGHVKVAPEEAPNSGVVFVPNRNCGGHPGVVVSEDNGVTWEVKTVPTGEGNQRLVDAAVAIGRDGEVYLSWQNDDGRARVAVSSNNGDTWLNDFDIGALVGVKNSVFPAVVAGDAGRAAVAFLGTSTPGDYENPGEQGVPDDGFQGVWYLYIATTFDGGETWTTVNATPGDPAQRGSICNAGTVCSNDPNDRNLLDFNGMAIDKFGRILVSFADGCLRDCITGSRDPAEGAYEDKSTIARQSGGRRMFAQFDPPTPDLPGAPQVIGERKVDAIHLTWLEPDDGGSPITAYKVYRSASAGDPNPTLLATVTGLKFIDSSADPGTEHFYKVTAVTANGEGPSCEIKVEVGVAESPCIPPGITVLTDPAGDFTVQEGLPQHDIRRVSIAEPYLGDDISKLVFTMKVESLPSLTPNTFWRVWFRPPNKDTPEPGDTKVFYVDMRTDAASNPTFKYGIGVDNGDGSYGAMDPLGDTDSGTFNPDGTIVIVISNSKVGSPTAAEEINTIFMRVIVGAVVPDNANYPNPSPEAKYQLVGNLSCKPNTAPLAVLEAVPKNGPAPLKVEFDGSESSDPDGDSIIEYHFRFGDGAEEVKSSPITTHTFEEEGDYAVVLTVKDSKGLVSTNNARIKIEVLPPPPYWPEWDIARGVELLPATRLSGYVLDGWGGLHPFGEAQPIKVGLYSEGEDLARAFELLPGSDQDGASGYILDARGGLHPFAAGDHELPGAAIGFSYWPGRDIARDLELTGEAQGYVLDGWGGVHPFGGAPPMIGGPYWEGLDIARDLELLSTGKSYVLDGWGGVHPLGGASAMTDGPYWEGWDIARDLEVIAAGAGWVLDGWGGVHSLGDAPVAFGGASWVGWDIANDLAMFPGEGGLVLEGWGGRHRFRFS